MTNSATILYVFYRLAQLTMLVAAAVFVLGGYGFAEAGVCIALSLCCDAQADLLVCRAVMQMFSKEINARVEQRRSGA